MSSAADELFERNDEVELWRGLGIKHRVVVDKSYHDCVQTIAFLLNCWLQQAKSKGLKFSVMADRLNATGLLAHPGHAWDGDMVRQLLILDRAIRGLPKPLEKPRKCKRFRYARSARPPRVTRAALKNRASLAWFEEISDLDMISSPYFRQKLEKLRQKQVPGGCSGSWPAR